MAVGGSETLPAPSPNRHPMSDPEPASGASKPTPVDFLGYAAVRGVAFALGLLPLSCCARVGAALGRCFFALSASYRKLAARNLRTAFAREMDDRARRSLLWRHAARLGANLACSLRMPSLDRATLDARVEVVGREHLAQAAADGRGAVVIVAHLGPWELLAQTNAYLVRSRQSGVIYQNLSNPLLDAYTRRCRARVGRELFARRDGFNAALALLRGGGVVGVLADQHAGDAGVFAPFFGRLASTTPLPLLLARRAKASPVMVGVQTTGPARWRIVIEPLPAGWDRDERSGLLAMNRSIEAMVRRSPEDWFWLHNRWKTPEPACLLLGHKRGWVLPDPGAAPLQPFRLLVRSPNWLGDACMAVPAVRAVKRGRPDLELTVLCPAKLAEFWQAVPEVDAVLGREGNEGVARVAARIRATGPFHAGLLLPNSPRVALEMRCGGVERVIGYAARWRRLLLHQVVPLKQETGPPRHHVEHYLQLAHRIGADCTDRALFGPIASSPPPEATAAGPARIGLCAGAEYGPAKRWPLDSFAAMAAAVLESRGDTVRWVLFGTPGEAALGHELEAKLEGRSENLVGKTTLAGLMDELRRCRLLVTNDTGTMHLAALLGVPVVALFGSTEPAWTRPLGRQHTILREHVACSPCFLRECPLDFRCMKAITPERVAAAVAAQLDREPA